MDITKSSLANTRVRKYRDGNAQENTQWHRVTFVGKLGEIAGEYLRKGSQVYVEGEIRYDKYTGQDGVEKYFTEIVANEMQMHGGRSEGGGGGERTSRPSQDSAPQRQAQAPQRQSAPPATDDFSDEGFPL